MVHGQSLVVYLIARRFPTPASVERSYDEGCDGVTLGLTLSLYYRPQQSQGAIPTLRRDSGGEEGSPRGGLEDEG